VPLLPSGPGGVRGLPLRRTRLSSASASFVCSYGEYIRVSASAAARPLPLTRFSSRSTRMPFVFGRPIRLAHEPCCKPHPDSRRMAWR
jgi:hypothetical protein